MILPRGRQGLSGDDDARGIHNLLIYSILRDILWMLRRCSSVAELLICNQRVPGSNPGAGSSRSGTQRATKADDPMKTVYLIQSIMQQAKFYSGITENLDQRIKDHNIGKSAHTAKYTPWRLRAAISFPDSELEVAFEKYLKSGSGRAFAKKHF
jgi:putative endonuclease